MYSEQVGMKPASRGQAWRDPSFYRCAISPPRSGRQCRFHLRDRGAFRSAFFDQPEKRPLDFGERSSERRPARVEDDIPLRSDLGAMPAERLPQPAFDAIPHDRASNGAWNRETQAGAASLNSRACEAKRREQGAGKADAGIIYHSEFGGAQDPARMRKSQRATAGRISWILRGGRLSHR